MTVLFWSEPVDLSTSIVGETFLAGFYVIHLKGFASGIDFNKQNNLEECNRAIDRLDELCEKQGTSSDIAIIFDGDSLSHDSFTHFISILPSRLSRHREIIHFFAFLIHIDDRHRFQESWNNSPLQEITMITASNYLDKTNDNLLHLGIHGLISTQSKTVLSLGGGDMLKNEYEAALKRDISFEIFDIDRIHYFSGLLQRCWFYDS